MDDAAIASLDAFLQKVPYVRFLGMRVELAGDDLAPELTPESTVGAWLEHPVAGPQLRADLGTGGFAEMFADPQNGEMMRAIPIVRMSRFPGFPVREEDLATRAAEANATR